LGDLFDYNEPLLTEWRDHIVEINEARTICNNVTILSEIPDEIKHVIIPGYTEVFPPDLPTQGQFQVNYLNGHIQFGGSIPDGTTVNVKYYGKGQILIGADRVYSHNKLTDIRENLQEIIDRGQEGIDALVDLSGFDHKGLYSSTTKYYKYNIVTYNGAAYICINDNDTYIQGIAPTDTTYWKRLSSFEWKGAYSSSATYNSGDFVTDTNNQEVYVCLKDNSQGVSLTDPNTWKLVVSVKQAITNATTATTNANNAANAANTAATNANNAANNAQTQANRAQNLVDTFTSKGAYNPTTSYVVNNIITYNGSTYRCKQNTTGNPPTDTTYWELLAQAGDVPRAEVGTLSNLTTSDKSSVVAAINEVNGQLLKQNKQSSPLSHGLNVINASQNSPLDIQIEGRTLVNVSQNTLDASKYYVVADKKSKIKFGDGTTYTGVAKFQGKTEKPILIRIDNFDGKVSGSTVENPHVAKANSTATTLQAPNDTWVENNQSSYDKIKTLDGTILNTNNTANAGIAQHLFSFNLIEAVERNIGKIPTPDTAGKVTWLRNNIANINLYWWGYGQSPTGSKANISIWKGGIGSPQWSAPPVLHTNNSVTKLIISTGNGFAQNYIDSNGFFHGLAYADPSDGTTASGIYTDYVELEIELNQNAQLYFPRFPLYEVDATTEYPNILTTWDANEVMRRYPMVESVQHVQNPYVIAEGDNLLPPFTDSAWTIHTNAVVREPYKLELNATGGNQASFIDISVLKNTNYTISFDNITGRVGVTGCDTGAVISTSQAVASKTFNTGNDSKIRIVLDNASGTTGTFTWTNPMLTLGSTVKPFVPRNPSYLFAEAKLGSLADKKDILWKDGQDWKIIKWIEKDYSLDGSLTWNYYADYTGFKMVRTASVVPPTYVNEKDVIVKYDGKAMTPSVSWSSFTSSLASDNWISQPSGLHITISDADSGWGESYTPTTQEISAYFYGWRMCNGTYGQPYDGTGTKTWYPIGDTDLSRKVTTCPTSAAPTIAEGKISNYKLSYVLATPQIIVVNDKVEGDLVVNGATQVKVGSGVIVREKVTWHYSSAFKTYECNNINDNSRLKYQVLDFFALYKGSEPFTKYTKTISYVPYGKYRLYINEADYDPAYDYYVTYFILDCQSFTTNILSVTANYDASIKSVVDDVVAKQSDIAAQVSVNVRAIAELYKRIKALGG
jgi:hypothetical protein